MYPAFDGEDLQLAFSADADFHMPFLRFGCRTIAPDMG
jgi:hypothetical protein